MLPWCCGSSAALSVLVMTVPERSKLDGVERRGRKSATWTRGLDCHKAAAWPNTPSEQLLARCIYFSMKIYQLLLLCLSLELLLWPSGISLDFWCHAWGWCDSPAWTAEEMSDFHLCSTLEIQKEENLLEEMPSCSFPSKLLFVICQTNRCHWRQTLVSNVLLDYQNMQQIIILIIKH